MEKKSRILEVAGPAGAGKSSLVSLLKKRNNGIRTDFIFQKIKYLPFFISSLPLLFRTFLYRFRNTRWFTWQEIKDLVYLKTLLHDIGRQASGDQTVIVLDQGPIFELTYLHAFGPESIKKRSFQKWWDRMLVQWSSMLEVVVWLDAPDKVLEERINGRDQWHRIKENSQQDLYEFMANYRKSYHYIISRLTAGNGLKIIQFDTEQESLGQIADKVSAEFK